jgi:hypothetical protein
LVYRSRLEVFDTLVKVFRNSATLFVSLWLCLDQNVTVGDYSDEVFGGVVDQDLTGEKERAFDYVLNGMFSRDA